MRSAINIRPEYSAQRRSHPPNPALKPALEFVHKARPDLKKLGKVGDLGCGKLRHYNVLAPCSDELYLIDTEDQLSATHFDAGEEYSVRKVAECARNHGKKVHVLSSSEFASSKLGLDLVVCIAVLDVVLPAVRQEVVRSAVNNLGQRGHFIVIAPRNDSTILKRCGPDNAFHDGHKFPHHGVHTFYHNFRDQGPIVESCKRAGASLLKDLSIYRQVCLIFKRQ
jgi:hypothetical protein